MRRILAALATLATLWALPACAQTVLQAPSIKYGGIFLTPPPGTLIVYDSGTGLPCILGSTVTCTLSSGGGGGGPATLAAASVAAGAYVSGSLLSGAVVDLTNIETTAGGTAPPKAASVQGIAGGTALPITGSLSNASTSGLATSSVNLSVIGNNYGFDGTVWRQIQAILSSGTLYDLGVHDTAAIAAINSPIPTQAATVTIGGVGAEGFTASGASLTENPLPDGCRAATASPTAVTDGQKVAAMCGAEGKQVVLPYTIKENALQAAASGSSGAIALTGMGAQGANIKIYILSCQAFRTDAGATLVYLSLNDSATTTIPLPVGGGSAIKYEPALAVAANTGVTFTPSATITSAFLNCQGYKGP